VTKSRLKLHFYAATSAKAQKALTTLQSEHGTYSAQEADIIVPLGGDGTMLEALHKYHNLGKPFYGMNRGSVGFLLNPYNEKDLLKRISETQEVELHPLTMTAHTKDNGTIEGLAFNEVSLFRQTRHPAKIKIIIDGNERLSELVCDGILLSTPAGSTAYNLSAHGPIIPLDANVLALTPISPFRPRRWKGALLSDNAQVTLEVLNPDRNSVRAETDATDVADVKSVDIKQSDIVVKLLFNPDHNLNEKIIKEQFSP
jgi:NAD+ kinase